VLVDTSTVGQGLRADVGQQGTVCFLQAVTILIVDRGA
jgi:hypothetical protein